MGKLLAGVNLDDNTVLPSKSDVLHSKDKSIGVLAKIKSFKVIDLDTFLLEDADYEDSFDILGINKANLNSNKDYCDFTIASTIDDDIFKVSARGAYFEHHDKLAVFINNRLCGESYIQKIIFYYDDIVFNYDLVSCKFNISYKGVSIYSNIKGKHHRDTLLFLVYNDFLSNSSIVRELRNNIYSIFDYCYLVLSLECNLIVPVTIKKLILTLKSPNCGNIVIPPSVDDFNLIVLVDYEDFTPFSITFNLSKINKDLIISTLLKDLRVFKSNCSDEELLEFFGIKINVY